MKFRYLFIIFVLFGCNFLGNSTKFDNKFFSSKVEYDSQFVFDSIKKYLYSQQADVYKIENNKIYARNLGKIFQYVNITTDILINIVPSSVGTTIEFSSLNYKLAQYFSLNIEYILKDIVLKDTTKETT